MSFFGFYKQGLTRISTISGLVAVALVLLTEAPQMRGNENTIRVTMKDSGSSITLHEGDVLEVALPATFGTGYSWKLANAGGSVMQTRGEPETAPGENQNKTGQTETQVFRFVATNKGTGEVKLHYVRPWEKDEKPAKVFSVTVEVR